MTFIILIRWVIEGRNLWYCNWR